MELPEVLPADIGVTQRRAVFNAFLEAKLFVEVELDEPSVSGLLS